MAIEKGESVRVPFTPGINKEKWVGFRPTHEPSPYRDLTIAKLYDLAAVTEVDYFRFLDNLALFRDPLIEAVYGRENRLAKLQFSIENLAFALPETNRIVPVKFGTWSADIRFGTTEGRKLNEDTVLARPFGKDRLLVAALDGASSQKPVTGLETYGVKGSWYVSHLAALGYTQTERFKILQNIKGITAKDIVVDLNNWLREKLSKVEGVDYNDVLTIPGMAATFALIDFNDGKISIGHVADTIGIAEYTDGFEVVTDNKNEKWDTETMAKVDEIRVEYEKTTGKRISRREAKDNPQVRAQLAESFRKKINTPNGTGILNGMPELETNGLIHTQEIEISPNLRKIHLATDGVHLAWTGRADIDDETKIRKILGALDNPHYRPGDPFYDIRIRLELDPDHEAIRRLGSYDDATYISVDFMGDNVPFSKFREENQNLLAADLTEIMSLAKTS